VLHYRYHIGWSQLLVFLITFAFTLTRDLLAGILAGTSIEMLGQVSIFHGFANNPENTKYKVPF